MFDVREITKAGFYYIPGETEEQPFPAGVGGCESFRIPGLIRLADGALFATCDARWTHPNDDCGGIDTIFALSEDGGAHWRAGYAAYFPDTLASPKDLRDATICIDSSPVQTPDGVRQTITIGLATAFEDASRTPELIRKADSALFRAKVGGGNRVALAKEEKMVPKTSHYTQDQLQRLSRAAKQEGIGEAILLREALDMLLKKYDV